MCETSLTTVPSEEVTATSTGQYSFAGWIFYCSGKPQWVLDMGMANVDGRGLKKQWHTD
jgi:hypothetical protein